MHTVNSILEAKGRSVFNIEQGATVLEAAEVMNERHVGALVVTADDRVVGIFTERDVLTRVVARRRDPALTTLRDVMTRDVAVCRPESTRNECRSVMRNHRIRHLPVVDDGRLVGMVSIGDLVEDDCAEQAETIQYLYEYMHGEWRQPVGLV